MNLSDAKYRITYEAFSKFSSSLSKAETLENLGKTINRHLKYLFNFKAFRIMLVNDGELNGYTFTKGKYIQHTLSKDLAPHELKLLANQVPFVEELKTSDLPDYLAHLSLNQGKLWGWFLNYTSYQVCTSLISDEEEQFDHSDAAILHLLAESVSSKYRQIYLGQKLLENNLNLERLVKEIELKNKEIEGINSNQQSIIESRTQELQLKNKKLIELSHLNAHDLREPLSRVLGLLEITSHLSDTDVREAILPQIKESAEELDTIIKRVVRQSEAEINTKKLKNEP